jgi:hypothetical protein
MKLYFLLGLLIFVQLVQAQTFSKDWVEYDIEKNQSTQEVLTMSREQKIAVFYKERMTNGFEYHIDLLGEDLQPIKRDSLLLRTSLSQSYSYSNEDQFYQILYSKSKGQFICFSLNDTKDGIRKTTGLIDGSTRITGMMGVGDMLYLMSRSGSRNFIVTVNLRDGSITKFDPAKQLKMQLVFQGIQRVATPEGYEVAYKFTKGKGRETVFSFIRFTQSGERLDESLMSFSDPEHAYVLLNSSLAKTVDGHYISTGTFGTSNSGTVSSGIYIARFTATNVEYIRYYNYLDIQHFMDFFPTRTGSKISKKKEKQDEKGEEYLLKFNVAIHDMIEWQGQYTFIGEFYYPTYRTYTTTTWVNGRPVTRTYTVFDGYQYTHSVIVSFADTGELKWSDAFATQPTYKPFYVKKFIRTYVDEEELTLIYATGSSLSLRDYSNDGTSKVYTKVQTYRSSESSETRQTETEELLPWYNNNFIKHGTQKVISPNDAPGNKRHWVYFIGKVTYDEY